MACDDNLRLVQQVTSHIHALLYDAEVPEVPADLALISEFVGVHDTLLELRSCLTATARGDLSYILSKRGVFAGVLKSHLAHLRHLTWQVGQVAAGDFSQRIDFMGDFSLAFNAMAEQLDGTLETLRQREAELASLAASLQREVDLRNSAVHALRQSEVRLKYMAEHDPLTEALNRRSFLELVVAELAQAAQENIPCCIGLLDVDSFKEFNDTYGHIEGDKALRHVVDRAASTLRRSDVMGRYGGEEFIFFFYGTKLSEGLAAAERILEAIKKEPIPEIEPSIRISASMGMSVIEPDWECERNMDFLFQIIRMADSALYTAKRLGKSRVHAADAVCPAIE